MCVRIEWRGKVNNLVSSKEEKAVSGLEERTSVSDSSASMLIETRDSVATVARRGLSSSESDMSLWAQLSRLEGRKKEDSLSMIEGRGKYN